MSYELKITKVHPDAKIPVRSTDYAAGYDLYALHSAIIAPKSKQVIGTGIVITLPIMAEPFSVYGSIRSRSGLSKNFSLETGAGVIDADYIHEIGVILYNHGDEPYLCKRHDRIAQLILEVHITPPIREVHEVPKVKGNRTGGFGSTGL